MDPTNLWVHTEPNGLQNFNGKGFNLHHLPKIKINTNILTYIKLMALDEIIPKLLWVDKFLRYHMYIIVKSNIYQDNRSSFFWRPMARHQVVSTLATSTSFFLLKTGGLWVSYDQVFPHG